MLLPSTCCGDFHLYHCKIYWLDFPCLRFMGNIANFFSGFYELFGQFIAKPNWHECKQCNFIASDDIKCKTFCHLRQCLCRQKKKERVGELKEKLINLENELHLEPRVRLIFIAVQKEFEHLWTTKEFQLITWLRIISDPISWNGKERTCMQWSKPPSIARLIYNGKYITQC